MEDFVSYIRHISLWYPPLSLVYVASCENLIFINAVLLTF